MWNRLYPEGRRQFPRTEPGDDASEIADCWHREELSLSLSENDGRSWNRPIVVAREKNTWIAYPHVFEPKPGLLWIWTSQGNLRVQVRETDLV